MRKTFPAVLAVSALVLATLAAFPATAAVSVRDSSAINKMRAATQALETQTGIIEEIASTGLEVQRSIGDPQTVALFSASAAAELQNVRLGAGWSRMQDQPRIWERLESSSGKESSQDSDSDTYVGLYIPDAITGEEEDFETYASTRSWLTEVLWAYREEGDLGTSVRKARDIGAARDVFARNTAVDVFTLAALGQHAVSDSSESLAAHQRLLSESSSIRSDLRVLALILMENARSQAAQVQLLSADLELRSINILAASPPLLNSRRLDALKEFPGAQDPGTGPQDPDSTP